MIISHEFCIQRQQIAISPLPTSLTGYNNCKI
jgi:hypothetical protein